MSTVLHRRHIPVNVAITADEAGREFVEASGDVQADFLRGMVAAVQDWRPHQSWAMQCRNIITEMNGQDRREARVLLSVLMDHLDEPC